MGDQLVQALLDQPVQALQDQLVQDLLDQLVQALLDQPAQALLDQLVQDQLDQQVQALLDQLVQDQLDQQVQALQDQQSLPLVAQLFLLLLFLLPQQSRNQQNQNRMADKLKEDNLAIRYIGISAFRQYFHSPFPSLGVISKKMDLLRSCPV